jgi:hypothetical protein
VPTYRLTAPDSIELLEADSCRVGGAHSVLHGTAYVMGRPREVVVRRVPRLVLVEEVLEGIEDVSVDEPSRALRG